MLAPFNFNTLEQLDFDPEFKRDGLIWFNKSEGLIKTYIHDELNIIATDKALEQTVEQTILNVMNRQQFTIMFNDVMAINVLHGKNNEYFNFSLYDIDAKQHIHAQPTILNPNEIRFEFVDSVSGKLFLSFV